ncbi:MAG: hypothetical protein ACI395_10005 [Candidatus Cryptobacteroides sp.]
MTKQLSLILTAVLLICIGTGCTEKEYRFRIADDPGYVSEPVLSVRALDGNRWVDGTLDPQTKTVSFKFRLVSSLENVVLDVVLNDEWARMTSPLTTKFEANLKNGFRFTVNDGVDDVAYTVSASIFQHITKVNATYAGATIEMSLQDDAFAGSFPNAFLQSDLTGVDIDLELDEDAELVSDPSILENVDFSTGAGLRIVVNDKAVDKQKTYYVYANPSDVVKLGSSWTEVTKTWQAKNIDFGNMRMYTCNSLCGYSGNVGYLFTVPAGRVNLKVVEKNDVGEANARMSPAVRNNRDWTLFLCFQGPGVWHIDGSEATSGFTYYSPLAYGPNKNGVTTVMRNDGFGGSNKTYAPALGLEAGKAIMYPSGTAEGKLYRYDDAKGTNPAEWTPECAFGGYFQIVKDGNNLISEEGEWYYNTYNLDWRRYGETLTTYWSPDWGKAVPIVTHDMLRTGRIGVGCTSSGDLVILAVEKFVNTHNQGQASDSGHNGASGDTRGVTLYELAKVMSEMGCSDVMTVEDYNWSYLLLQDGSERGKDVFWTNNRFNFAGNEMKAESSENVNMIIACFK